MPAFCTSGLRSFVDSSTLLAGYDPVMRCGVDRQLPVGHVVYHGDSHATYLRQCHEQHAQVRAEPTKRQATTGAVKNENDNEKERNLTAAAMLCTGSVNSKTQKYDISLQFVCSYRQTFNCLIENLDLEFGLRNSAKIF